MPRFCALPTLLLLCLCVGCRKEQDGSPGVATADAQVPGSFEEVTFKPTDSDEPSSPPDPPPASSLADHELRSLARDNLGAMGSLSLGQPHQGALINPVQLADGPNWIVAYPDNAWATMETLGYLKLALGAAELQAGPAAYIGDLSASWGGPLSPHQSHQSGRDVDIGYYRLDDRWWADASEETLDTARTWALLRAIITTTDVEVIFVDRSLQPLLRAHALRAGTSEPWLDRLFEPDRSNRRSLIRHAPEHLNHLHVRFYNPEAQRVGRAVHDLVARGVRRAPPFVVPNRCLPASCR